ncbi:hypothetical protein DPMN_014533 [Dreissena polymorpha]|uniref:Uncharacterized protein n=1 Tax=Dreissena polymorpha TaxID=45954 RepID=A0A9D4N669_DREPO|nr:hypothetical protein DPMN_014533 [Dreissena polymorpha]
MSDTLRHCVDNPDSVLHSLDSVRTSVGTCQTPSDIRWITKTVSYTVLTGEKQSGDMSDTLRHSVDIPNSLLASLDSVRNSVGTCQTLLVILWITQTVS